MTTEVLERPATTATKSAAAIPGGRLMLAGLGMLILQLAWILVVPAFAGIDEFDHVYRASGVANGQWVTEPTEATRGTGAWVLAESDLVDAAHVECSDLRYTTDADCVGTPRADRITEVASGAGRYNPIFYALVGYPALPFEGRSAVFAMRGVAALLCTGLFVAGLFALRRIATSSWAWAGAAAAVTPVVSYSTMVVAPNGAEIMAGFTFWCAVLALLRTPSSSRVPTGLVVLTAVSGSLLVSLRSLGPVWCLLIAALSLATVAQPFSTLRRLASDRGAWIAAGAVTVSTLASVWWIRSMGSLRVGVEGEVEGLSVADKLGQVGGDMVLWVFQGFAAFPYRNEIAPIPVYACYLVLTLILLGLAVYACRGRAAIILGAIIVLSLLVPGVISYSTMATHSGAWQGRYGLPFTIGLFVVAGLAIRRRIVFAHLPWILAVLAALSITLSLYRVLAIKAGASPSLDVWWAPPSALIIVLAVLGSGLLWLPALESRTSS